MAADLSYPRPSRTQHFEVLSARDRALAKLLMAFVSTGLLFMLFPGTFCGVWNLLQISGRANVAAIAPAWIQAHGHAQVFGWVGSFIMGIGLFSIPQLRAGATAFGRAWACWAMWTAGVALRWATNVYRWEWRVMLPVSAVLELAAFLVFFRAVSQHQSAESGQEQLKPWLWVVISASTGFLLVLVLNLAGCFYVALRGATPAFPHVFDQRYLAVMAWGFLVPFVWGFSAKWMEVFLGLKPVRPRILLLAVLVNLTGIALALAGWVSVGVWFFLGASVLAIAALRMFEAVVHEPKTRGVHRSFPFFIRLAYVWLLVAAGLGTVAVRWDHSGGIWGASRHALTVGFISVVIVSVGQRILPAFAGMRQLWKPRLMLTALLLLTIGCTLRVSSEVLAYQEYVHRAWLVLPLSALLELAGLSSFAINLAATFVLQPSHAVNEPMVARISGVNF
jgi:uncharacterized protein involved in response to NO